MAKPKVEKTRIKSVDISKALKRERPDLDIYDYLHFIYALRLGRLLNKVDERHCRERFDISAADMRVLIALRRSGPSYSLRPTQLFRTLAVSSGGLTKQIDRLTEQGYVSREMAGRGTGGLLVHLTKTGFELADEAMTGHARFEILPKEVLTYEERQNLVHLMGKMLSALEDKLQDDHAEA